MSKKVVAILEPKNISSTQFNLKFHSKIDSFISNPNCHFIISENFIFAAKYLEKIGFRNCTIYHIGDEPKHIIGKFKNQGGFSSYLEIREALKQNSDEIIED